ncbi:MAG TPA: DUF3775 domain-containing protein [Rhizomicrobium sp.]|jgi:hypothetical protein|nr:DUF3775 domain-containing protein [Rhizomicrobium sp.]
MTLAEATEGKAAPELTIALEKVDYVIVKARQFDVKEADSDPDEGSNPTDDGQADVLEDDGEDAVRQELVSFINAMDVDEKAELVALAWLGRGTYEIDEWQTALETAKTEHGKRTAQYLLDLPLLGDYLADGLAEFGEEYSENEVD